MTDTRTEERRLIDSILVTTPDAATMAVLEAAMKEAISVTHECGTPDATDAAVLDTFWDAVETASRWKAVRALPLRERYTRTDS